MSGVRVADPYWNHNVHYHPVVVDAVPDGCRTVLDVGCGDGLLARKLASRAGSVTGVDRSPQMIRLARADVSPENVTFVEADYLDATSLAEGTYDFVSAVAVVHHTEFEDAVARLASLLAPGGRLVIVGLAYNRTFLDWVISGCGLPVSRFLARWNGGKLGPVGMPIEDSAMCWGEAREGVRRLLPGARFRRRLLWRYVAEWDKPVE
ncbi:class I SAM-dependent methyltransferase [Streptomyces prunicolor]|uniref:Class I SAM-dependent methyltransferase n=1 Tax=Streptomyces prunicolor TaxID=67348 RepID=A0ABU4FP51_9ACTN|nr:class I SAM-dependent methyltransferase [Streptomyces prunicolor]MDV7222309.1 class I SAM-dependent methyltransferase [Streptomyces prunicolor]